MKRVLVLLAILGLVVAGCGREESRTQRGATPEANETDVEFLQSMIPHHREALEMAMLAETRAASPQVKELAGRIIKAQQPEIDQMEAMLRRLGESSSDSEDAMAGHEGGNTGMSPERMAVLEKASGTEFDRMFLEMMIEHHQGAIEMSEKELEGGRFDEAKDLARKIRDAQQAEIAEMRTLLERLP